MIPSLLISSPLLALALLGMLSAKVYRGRTHPALRRWRHLFALFFIWCWLCCLPGSSNLMFQALEGPPPPLNSPPPEKPAQPNTTIIVLGSGELFKGKATVAPRLDENGWERLHAGVKLWKQTGGKIIFTGGPTDMPHPSLAGQMGDIAQEMGVPASAIGLALGSQNTYEDLLRAQALITPGSEVWLVTSAIHMPRCLAVSRKLGIEAKPYRVDYRQIRELSLATWLPNNDGPSRFQITTHEWLGLLYYRYKGWAD